MRQRDLPVITRSLSVTFVERITQAMFKLKPQAPSGTAQTSNRFQSTPSCSPIRRASFRGKRFCCLYPAPFTNEDGFPSFTTRVYHAQRGCRRLRGASQQQREHEVAHDPRATVDADGPEHWQRREREQRKTTIRVRQRAGRSLRAACAAPPTFSPQSFIFLLAFSIFFHLLLLSGGYCFLWDSETAGTAGHRPSRS